MNGYLWAVLAALGASALFVYVRKRAAARAKEADLEKIAATLEWNRRMAEEERRASQKARLSEQVHSFKEEERLANLKWQEGRRRRTSGLDSPSERAQTAARHRAEEACIGSAPPPSRQPVAYARQYHDHDVEYERGLEEGRRRQREEDSDDSAELVGGLIGLAVGAALSHRDSDREEAQPDSDAIVAGGGAFGGAGASGSWDEDTSDRSDDRENYSPPSDRSSSNDD